MSRLLVVSILVTLCLGVIVNACKPGYYSSEYYGCQICPIGMRCPDGEHAYNCENGFYNNKEGAVTCIPCNNNGAGSSDPHRDMCLLPDTPKDSNSYDMTTNSFINITMTRPFYAYVSVIEPYMDPRHNLSNKVLIKLFLLLSMLLAKLEDHHHMITKWLVKV